MSRLLVTHGTVVTAFPGTRDVVPAVIPDGAVVIEGDRIVAVGPAADLASRFADCKELDARGGTIFPGLINLHHHFYSSLARGLDPGGAMGDFAGVLDGLWWRLDRALDGPTVRLSARLALADCVRWGCTTVFDHHASPSRIDGVLDDIAGCVEAAGLSAMLCYEITDRNGHDGALKGLRENVRFLEARPGGRIRGLVGLHASFTLGNETLAAVADHAGAGCHVHIAEDPVDGEASRSAFGKGPVERLADYGLLHAGSVLVHGIHLSDAEYDQVGESGAVLVHCPESNANNSVGRLDVDHVAGRGVGLGLGTDGMSSAMLGSLRAAFLTCRAAAGPNAGFDTVPALLGANATVAGRLLGEPLLGEIAPGAPADLMVLDAAPVTPMKPANLAGHLLYGYSEPPVRHTVARGEVLLRDFAHTREDTVELSREARAAAPALWERFGSMDRGTSFLGGKDV